MSGGHFDYQQFHISEIIDSIERTLNRQGKLKPKDELWNDEDFYRNYPDEKYYKTYPQHIQEKMHEGVNALKIANIYAQRIDWYLSDDDGDESFLQRLSNELENLKNTQT